VLVDPLPTLTDEPRYVGAARSTLRRLAVRHAMEVLVGSDGIRFSHLLIPSNEVRGASADLCPVFDVGARVPPIPYSHPIGVRECEWVVEDVTIQVSISARETDCIWR